MTLFSSFHFSSRLHLTVDEFAQDVNQMRAIRHNLAQEFPRCFCHGDIHPLNLVYNKEKGTDDISIIFFCVIPCAALICSLYLKISVHMFDEV